MKKDYNVHLTSRNEGVEYQDSTGTYYFNVSREHKTWIVYLPCYVGDKPHELTLEDTERILPRIFAELQYIKWVGFFGCHFNVRTERQEPFDVNAYIAEQSSYRLNQDIADLNAQKRLGLLSRLFTRIK